MPSLRDSFATVQRKRTEIVRRGVQLIRTLLQRVLPSLLFLVVVI